jgi:hypothetical protein
MIRRVDYVDLLQHSARCAGLDPDTISTAEFRDFRLFHGDRLQRLWELRDWAEIKPVEKRYFRDLYAAGTSYAAGAEVFYPGPRAYYQMLRTGGVTGQVPATVSGSTWTTNLAYWAECQTEYTADEYDASATYVQGDQVYYSPTDRYYQLFAASATGDLPSDTSKWGVLTPFNRYVAYAQTGQTAFDHAFAAYDRDPENDGRAKELNGFLSENGLQVLDDVPWCWVEFRRRVPSLTGDAWEAAATYASGAQVYFQDGSARGNFYDCLEATTAGQSPLTHAAKWRLVEIPFTFRGALIHGAAADYARPDGHLAIADREERLARDAQEQAVLTFDAQAAHSHRTVVHTR